MSLIDIYSNNVKRKKEEISRLKKERLKYVGSVSDSSSKIVRAKQQANSTKSQATYKSKLNEISREVKFYYDFAKRLSSLHDNDLEIEYDYNENNKIVQKTINHNDINYSYNYEFDLNNCITNINVQNKNINYTYDSLGRLIKYCVNGLYERNYDYKSNGKKTSTIVNCEYSDTEKIKYEYDNYGNIINILRNNDLTREYKYDNQNQLIESNDLQNNYKEEYTYDTNGNILYVKKYRDNIIDNEDKYVYENTNWPSQLTKFNDDIITYDMLGNPLSIGTEILEWKNGRELKRYTNGNVNITYSYDIDGIRNQKIINDEVVDYFKEGKNIVVEKRNNYVIYYLYELDEIIGFVLNNNTYFYTKNVFGDILGIINEQGNEIVSYEYDSWGNIKQIIDNSNIELGTKNPFRYRSYYYDEESKLYYLNSRYYSPKLRRFINSDSEVGTDNNYLSYNPYLYVGNNPIHRKDRSGNGWWIAAATIVGGIIGAATQVVTNVIKKEKNILKGVTGSAVAGAITGFSVATGNVGLGSTVVAALAKNTINEIEEYIVEDKKITKKNLAQSAGEVIVFTAVDTVVSTITGSLSDMMISPKIAGAPPTKFVTSFFGTRMNRFVKCGLISAELDILASYATDFIGGYIASHPSEKNEIPNELYCDFAEQTSTNYFEDNNDFFKQREIIGIGVCK